LAAFILGLFARLSETRLHGRGAGRDPEGAAANALSGLSSRFTAWGIWVIGGRHVHRMVRGPNWNEKSRGLILKRICGVLVLLGGVYLIYSA
jgi:hypothetical protein